ncbi:MAG: ABC transporter substrate-binding protein, partial [Deltaproteobacteria bacterium]|nr:ABC transporter substrate-binding protein [Deltaproteobacteria bacterium]
GALGMLAPDFLIAAKKSIGTFWFNQPFQADNFKKVIARFRNSQDKYDMNIVLVPQPEMPTKLATAIGGGEPPDAVRLGKPVLNSLFIDRGQAVALDDFEPKIGTYDWIPAVQQAVTRNGKMYAMPVNSGCLALVYNKELYEASGLDPERPPTTLMELLETATKIAKPSQQIWGHYVMTAPTHNTGGFFFEAILWAFGSQVVSDDGKEVVFNSPDGVAALKWYHDLIRARKVMPVKQVTETIMLNDFLTGKVGSMFSFPATLARVAAAKFKAGTARMPKGPKGSKVPVGFGTIMVLKKAKNIEAGWAFTKFIGLDPENAAFWNISFGQLPARYSYRETPSWKEYQEKNPLVNAYLEGQKTAALSYYGPGTQEISTRLAKAIEAVAFGKQTPKEALDKAAVDCQRILNRERKRLGL